MKKFSVSVLLSFVFTLFFNSASASQKTNPYYCALYDKVKIRDEQKVLAVGIKQVLNDSVEVYVLGFGSPIKASINDINIGQSHIKKRRTINCSGDHVGQVRTYDLSYLDLDGGLFKLQSEDKVASTYIEIN